MGGGAQGGVEDGWQLVEEAWDGNLVWDEAVSSGAREGRGYARERERKSENDERERESEIERMA